MQDIGDKDSNIFDTVHERYEKEEEAGNFDTDPCRILGDGMARDACEAEVEHNERNDEAAKGSDGT